MLLYEILDKQVDENPDKRAVICGTESCTYSQLFDRMNLWAETLLSLGIKRGDRVALFMKNRVELVQLSLFTLREAQEDQKELFTHTIHCITIFVTKRNPWRLINMKSHLPAPRFPTSQGSQQ